MEQDQSLIEAVKAAESGDLGAMIDAISLLEIQSYGKQQSPKLQARLLKYKQALVDAGSPVGCILMASEYLKGQLVPKDVHKAIELYRRAAAAGDDYGNQCLGHLYFEGKFVPQDYQKALHYFTLVECEKEIDTLYCLAEMYRQGLGVPVDLQNSYALYKNIVEDDSPYVEMDDYYPRACFRLAQMLHQYGREDDKRYALELLETSREALLNRDEDDIPTGISEEEFTAEWRSLSEELGQ